jgi:hypothetical protein
MGGENRDADVIDFPDLGRRMFRHAKGIDVVDLSAVRPME